MKYSYVSKTNAVFMSFLGRQWYLGTEDTPLAAAYLADSALFHCWGFARNPDPARFNLFIPDVSPAPVLLPKAQKLRENLTERARIFGLVPAEYMFSFADRNNFPKPDFYPS